MRPYVPVANLLHSPRQYRTYLQMTETKGERKIDETCPKLFDVCQISWRNSWNTWSVADWRKKRSQCERRTSISDENTHKSMACTTIWFILNLCVGVALSVALSCSVVALLWLLYAMVSIFFYFAVCRLLFDRHSDRKWFRLNTEQREHDSPFSLTRVLYLLNKHLFVNNENTFEYFDKRIT